MAYTPEQIMEMGMSLKKLVDTGALGPRAASIENPLLPGEVLDLLWTLIFGKSKEECKTGGGLFVLGTWKDQPIMSWHLNKINIHEIIGLLTVTVGMIEDRVNKQVTLSVGLGQKVKKGDQFVVFRKDRRIGKVEVEKIFANTCSARIFSEQPKEKVKKGDDVVMSVDGDRPQKSIASSSAGTDDAIEICGKVLVRAKVNMIGDMIQALTALREKQAFE